MENVWRKKVRVIWRKCAVNVDLRIREGWKLDMEEKIFVKELKFEWKNCKEKGGMNKPDLTDHSLE